MNITALSTILFASFATTSMAAIITSTNFGGGNLTAAQDGFSHTGIDDSNTFLTFDGDSVDFRNQSTGTADTGFIKQFDGTSINRTADTGIVYTVTGVVTIQDGYADDNNRLGMVLFTDPTTVLSRSNSGQIGIIWNTDDGSAGGAPGNNSQDNLNILNGYNNVAADGTNAPAQLRNQATPFGQTLLQGTQITFTTSFEFVGSNIEISSTMTDAGGLTSTGTATVLAADYTGEYFGFVSAYRARNYDGTPDPTGAARDNPLVMEYQSFQIESIPEPSFFALFGAFGIGMLFVRRRRD